MKRKLSGSMNFANIKTMNSQLQEISEIIASLDIMNKLSADNTLNFKKISQDFSTMTIEKEVVETILGTNYKFNWFKKDNRIEFNYNESIVGYEKAEAIEQLIKAFPFKTRSSVNPKGFSSFEVKCNINLGTNIESDKIMDLISTLKIK